MEPVFDNIDSQDIDLLKKQLNCDKITACGILRRCTYGFPQIILLSPFKEENGKTAINYEAMSNIMWLTCPYLNRKIHELENALYIKIIKEIIENNPVYKEAMLSAHTHYYFTRNFIFQRYANSLSEFKIDPVTTGIGGIRDLCSIKCLHLHFCHYFLYPDNIVGYITYCLLGKNTDCNDAMCRSMYC